MTPSSKARNGINDVLVHVCIRRHDKGCSYCLLCCFCVFLLPWCVMRTVHSWLQVGYSSDWLYPRYKFRWGSVSELCVVDFKLAKNFGIILLFSAIGLAPARLICNLLERRTRMHFGTEEGN